jgi:hypothetical protein
VAAAVAAVVVTPFNVLITVLLYTDQWLCKVTLAGGPSVVPKAPEPT